MDMRKKILLILLLINLSIMSFLGFSKALEIELDEEDALVIGEEKYLEFLWMVDGAFNDERLGNSYLVNNKSLSDTQKLFTCIYQNKKKNTCVGKNFPDTFNNLFSKKITYNDVYGDGAFYTWYKYEKGEHLFTILDECNVGRMDLNQKIELEKINHNEIIYRVSSLSNLDKNKTFILVKEDGMWKISKAYYQDLCEMHYNIG